MRIVILSLLFLSFPVAGCDLIFVEEEPHLLSGEGDLPEAFDAYLEDLIHELNIPGIAVAIVQNDEIVMAKGYGFRDVERGLPATADTLFHIGSTNKSMTAILVATLVDEGMLEWDQPVVEVVPSFELSVATETVTMRHLLSMRSGIPDYAEDSFDMDSGTAEELLAYVANVELLGEPGDEFSYSNISASLGGYLAVLVENGQADDLVDGYADLLQARILDPIGMDSATIRYTEALKDPNYGRSYILDRGEIVEAEPEDLDGDPLAPSGVLKASASEMALYISTQLNKGRAPNGNRIVSEENLVEMWRPYLEGYAMGWEVNQVQGVEHISHEGSFDNYLSIIGFVPELDFGYVILTNSADAAEDLISDAPDFLIDYVLHDEGE